MAKLNKYWGFVAVGAVAAAAAGAVAALAFKKKPLEDFEDDFDDDFDDDFEEEKFDEVREAPLRTVKFDDFNTIYRICLYMKMRTSNHL